MIDYSKLGKVENVKPIWLSGVYRSGTTFLAAVVNNISNIKSYFPKYLKLRKIPSIYFYLDETIENAEKMHKILDNLK